MQYYNIIGHTDCFISLPISGCLIDTDRLLTSFRLRLLSVKKKESVANGPGVAIGHQGGEVHQKLVHIHTHKYIYM